MARWVGGRDAARLGAARLGSAGDQPRGPDWHRFCQDWLPQRVRPRGTQAEGGSQGCAQGAARALTAARAEPRRAARSAGTPGQCARRVSRGHRPAGTCQRALPSSLGLRALLGSLPFTITSSTRSLQGSPFLRRPTAPTPCHSDPQAGRRAGGRAGELCPALRAPPTGRARGTPVATCPPSAPAVHDAQTLPRAPLHPKLRFPTHPELLACRARWGAQEAAGDTWHPCGSRLASLPRGTGQR